ncbi:MAG: N-acetylmuramoyl-L-alanine amidase, partial [Firmicutes bacterium]|nr:N-acetylmuramoyl-L-alanine amidase [Bacillota bacterium]
NPQAKGMEVWTTRGQTGADSVAESVANALIAAFPDMVFRADMSDGDKDKEANFYVLRYTDAPAVLVELGFITNPTEEAMLEMPDYQAKAARVIAEGVAGYFGLTLPDPAFKEVVIQAGGKTILGILMNSRTYAPVRALAESLGHVVEWDEATKTATIK